MQETQETRVWSLDQEDHLEEVMATYSSILARRISRTEGSDGLQSIGSQRIRHYGVNEHSSEYYTILPYTILFSSVQFSSVAQSCLTLCDSHGLQHTRPRHPSPTPRVHPNPCTLSRWYHPTNSSSVVPFSSHLQSFPVSGLQGVSSSNQVPKVLEFQLQYPCCSSNEHPGLISFRMDWLDHLAVQGTLKSLLQHHSAKASLLWCSAFFIVQLSHPYMTTGKTIALTRWTFVGK